LPYPTRNFLRAASDGKGGIAMAKLRARSREKRKRVTLTLDAPEAREVILMGDFNNWNPKVHPMKKDRDSTWKKIVMLSPGRYEYKFLVDGQWWHDPSNQLVCHNCFGTQNDVLLISGT
jgi:1,4-alpha-glucan branching enzyme